MKLYTFKSQTFLITILIIFFSSCDTANFLDEKPLDFYDPSNSFKTVSDFNRSLVDLYAKRRDMYYGGSDLTMHLMTATDIFFNARETDDVNRFGSYTTTLNPTKYTVEYYWDRNYKIISNANTILAKLEPVDIDSLEKTKVEAEARFFRALAYRDLVYLYGGVPLIIKRIKSPRTDFTRTSKEKVLNQIVKDASFASSNLPGISEVEDGRLNNLVAKHYLAETYLSLGKFQKAISVASEVINDPNTKLMTERFGSRADEPGDVYWDLFRRGNQNRSSGNTEALWVAQMEVDVPGGLLDSGSNAGNKLERNHVPAIWTLNDPDGVNGFLGPRSDANVGGRGVSFIRGTILMEQTLWKKDFDNDIRNSKYNFVRTLTYDNPASAYFGKSALKFPGTVIQSASWRWYPWLTKVTTPGNHPTNLYTNKKLKLLSNGAGSTYRDRYYLRLAETYLLRAEAYLKNGEPDKAADDINVVRSRANASPVTPGEVDLDYILDERARELSFEEQRRITLQRVGKLVERVRKYNPWNADEIQDYNALYPIPASEIEANTDADLKQNPGY